MKRVDNSTKVQGKANTPQARYEAHKAEYCKACTEHAKGEINATRSWAEHAYGGLADAYASMPRGGDFTSARRAVLADFTNASGRKNVNRDVKMGRLLEWCKAESIDPWLTDVKALQGVLGLFVFDAKNGEYAIDGNHAQKLREWFGSTERTTKTAAALATECGKKRASKSAGVGGGDTTEADRPGTVKPNDMQAGRASDIIALAEKPGVALGKLLGQVPEESVCEAVAVAVNNGLDDPSAVAVALLEAIQASTCAEARDSQPGSESVQLVQMWEGWEALVFRFRELHGEVVELVQAVSPVIRDRLAKVAQAKRAAATPAADKIEAELATA